jgi:hypothetical protein
VRAGLPEKAYRAVSARSGRCFIVKRSVAYAEIKTLAGFPFLRENKVHGLLFVANRYARKLSGPETSLLGAFALHAGVAMRNANAFAMLSESLDEAQRNRSALIEHIQRVEAAASAHDELTDLLASGADIRQFLEKMSNRIGGAVFLYDDEFRIHDEFGSSANKSVLADELRVGQIDLALLINANGQSRHTSRSVVVLERGNEQCRAIAFHGGNGRCDSLVICHIGELDAIEIRNLELSAVALSIAKLWNERRETEKLITSSTLLRHLVLVTPPDHSIISAVRERLGLRGDQHVQLTLIAMSGMDRISQTARLRECARGQNVLVDLLDDAYLAIGPPACDAGLPPASVEGSGILDGRRRPVGAVRRPGAGGRSFRQGQQRASGAAQDEDAGSVREPAGSQHVCEAVRGQ